MYCRTIFTAAAITPPSSVVITAGSTKPAPQLHVAGNKTAPLAAHNSRKKPGFFFPNWSY